MDEIRYVALGDSFTEGVGDDLPNGGVRGWADLVAEGLAASGARVRYANLAIRGRLLGPIIDEQLPAAIALGPTLVTFNGGGNDILRPRSDPQRLLDRMTDVMDRIAASGAQLVLLSGANPTAGLPMQARIAGKGDALNASVAALAAEHGMLFADNWSDRELARSPYWSRDRLHLGPVGHHRVAARVLATLGYEHPPEWIIDAPGGESVVRYRDELAYYREHVVPWIQRRLTGRSSGDGRTAKYGAWTDITPGA
jgi:lysophospholipase L1-like esterase